MIISDNEPIARKDYRCEASEIFLESGLESGDLDQKDCQSLNQAHSDRWMIRKGQPYRKAIMVDAGIFTTYRARLDMDAICTKHKLFEDFQ